MAASNDAVSTVNKFPEGRHSLRLGDSFFSKSASLYHTLRYDFKPASVEDCKETYVEVAENQEVTVTVPKVDETGDVKDATIFKGPRKQYQKECLLIYNHDTGEFVLEQLSHNIQLKKTRGQVTEEVLQNIRETRKKLQRFNAADGSSSAQDLFPKTASTTSAVANDDEKEAELMSDSEGFSGSESSSKSDGELDDERGSVDGNDVNNDYGGIDEDELAKSLEAELSSSHNPDAQKSSSNSASMGNADKGNSSYAPPQASASSASHLHEDLLLSESSDED